MTAMTHPFEIKPFQEKDNALYSAVNERYREIFSIDTKDPIRFISPGLIAHINKQIRPTADKILALLGIGEPLDSFLDNAWGNLSRTQTMSAKILNSGIRHNTTLLMQDLFRHFKETPSPNILELGCGNGLATTRLYEAALALSIKDLSIFSIDSSILSISATYLLCRYLEIPVQIVKGESDPMSSSFRGVLLIWDEYQNGIMNCGYGPDRKFDAVLSNMGLSYCSEDLVEKILSEAHKAANPNAPLVSTSLRNVIVDLARWYRKFAVKMYNLIGKWPFNQNRYQEEMRDGVKRTILKQWNEGEACKKLYEFLNYLVFNENPKIHGLHQEIQVALEETQKFTQDLIDEVSFQNDSFSEKMWDSLGYKVVRYFERAYEEGFIALRK